MSALGLSRGFWLGLSSSCGVAVITESFGLAFMAFAGLYLSLGGWKFWWLAYRTVPRDLRSLKTLMAMQKGMKQMKKEHLGIHDWFEETTRKHPDKVAIRCGEEAWSFHRLDKYANRVARLFQAAGLLPGDTVCVFMENCPQYAAIYLGLAKIGVISSLINYNLRFDSLHHCISVSKAKAVIFSSSLASHLNDIDISDDIKLFCQDGKVDLPQSDSLPESLAQCGSARPVTDHQTDPTDSCLYIFTSGTTGMPKPARISHYRFYYFSIGMGTMQRMRHDDVLYMTLPMYHTNGTLLSVGMMIQFGLTLVIRKKFSASRFWEDCCQYGCTTFIYIGEICRFLLAQPPRQHDRQHKIRRAFGNGLQRSIWEEFQKRFNIPVCGEFYGSTEGNVGVVNGVGKVGSVGYVSPVVPSLFPVCLIKRDEETGLPMRGPDGLCVQCCPGEPGEMIGKVKRDDPLRRFDGYVDKEQSNKKIVCDVKAKGDAWFMSGDVLTQDEEGYFYFKDRTGDTFRWRGENVSTFEVETTISKLLGKKDVAVYGVAIPGVEGKAGMALITTDPGELDLEKLGQDMEKALPSYARPVFLRLTSTTQLTGTFKFKKTSPKKEGYDVRVVKDPLFYLNPKSKKYEILTQEVYEQIEGCQIRF
eukprot:m.236803 g.236803  ORF g.236803 m.236803 type:complete len:643 (+) comp40140_c0_seq1:28-1956(+)